MSYIFFGSIAIFITKTKCPTFSYRDFHSTLCLYDLLLLFSVVSGHHQQHRHPQHDLHQNLPEVWPVGRQPGQHRLRPGLLHGAAAAAGKHSRAHTVRQHSKKILQRDVHLLDVTQQRGELRKRRTMRL